MTGETGWGWLEEELAAERVRNLHVAGLLVIDRHALPVASTLHAPDLEARLCGLAAALLDAAQRAADDGLIREASFLWLAGAERQVLLLPLRAGLWLLAVGEARGGGPEVAWSLLSLARRLLARWPAPHAVG